MRHRLGHLAVLVAAATAKAGATEIKLEFGSPAPREVYVAALHDLDSAKPAVVTEAAGATVDVGEPKGKLVVVYEPGTGRCAAKPAADLAAKPVWKLATADFGRAAQVRFDVEDKDGKPVAQGLARLSGRGELRERLLAADGTVTFRFVPAGAATVEVLYRKPDGSESRESQAVSIVGGKAAADFTVRLPAVMAPVSAPPQGPAEPKPTAPAWPNLLAGLALAGAAGYALYRFVLRNPESVRAALDKVGVPDSDASADDDAPPPPTAGPKPLEPIVLDAPATPAPAAAAVAVAPAANPRLVGADGSVTLLDGRTVRVGRDPSLELGLVAEQSVSRSHAQVEPADGGFVLTDLGSTNGTFVNGRRIEEPTRLSPGDQVQFGGATFRFEV